MPTFINTKDYKAGIIKGNSWASFNTALGPADGHYFLSENLGMLPRERLKDESIGSGSGFFKTVNLGNFSSDKKTITEWFRLDMSEYTLAYCFGADSVSTLPGINIHELTPANNIDGRFMSFAIQKKEASPTVIHSYPSIKIDGIKISGESGGLLQLESSVIPSHLINSTAIGANGATGLNFDNLTFRNTAINNRIPFNIGTFYLANWNAGTFTDSDIVCPSKFEFEFLRNLEIYSCSNGSTSIAQALIDEPTGGGYPECNVVLEFPTKSDDINVTNHLNGTNKKLKIVWPLTYSGGDLVKALELYFPKLDISNIDQATDNLGKIMEPLQMSAYVSNIASSGMPNVDVPVTIRVFNTHTLSILI